VLLVLIAAGAAPAQAQIGLAGGAMGYQVTRRVSYLGTVHQQTGVWFGAQGGVTLGSVTIGVSGLLGKIAGDSDQTTNPDLDVRVSDLWGEVRVSPWLALGMTAEARRQQSIVGVTSWRLIGGTVRLMPALGLSGLAGSAEVTYFGSASVIGRTGKISPAIRATLGATYAPPPGRVEFRVGYRFERFDFAASGSNPARLEQFGGVLAGIGVRLGGSR
jgi:hypothetical protein